MATQQLKINTLSDKIVQTKYGAKEQWVVNGKWTAFKGSWNTSWKVGETASGIFKQNGKYFNIECPPELKKQNFGAGDQVVLNKILNELIIIRTELQKTEDEVPVETEPEIKVSEVADGPEIKVEEIDVSNIPF